MPRPALALAALTSAGIAALSGCHGHDARQPGGPGGPPEGEALAAFDPSAVGPGAPPKPGPARPLEVVDHGPVGRTEGNGEIHVRFNQPVVALDLAASDGLAGLITLDPPLPGRVSWKTPDLLVFEPDEPLRDCHAYTVRFAGGITGLDGQRFDRPLTWSFETVRPTVTGSEPSAGAVDQRRDRTVLVQFDRPVALAEVRAHVRATARPLSAAGPARQVEVTVRAATKKEMEEAFYWVGERQVFAVKARGLWPVDSELELEVTPGLRSEAGPLPLDTPWKMAFRTYRPQAIERLSCAPAEPCGLEPITLTLRNPVREAQLRRISVTPRPKELSVSTWYDWGEGAREVTISGIFVPGTTYTVHVPGDMRDIYGQTIAGGARREALIAPKASLGLSAGSGILIAGRAQTIGVESRHVKAVRVRAGVFDDRELDELPGEPAGLARLAFPARVVERTIALDPTGKGDWSSIALDLADLVGGARRPVLVEVSAAELVPRAEPYGAPPPVRSLVRLTDLGPVATTSLPASSVQVLRLSSGQPVPKVNVHRFDDKGALVLLGATGAGGELALPAGLVGDDRADPVRLVLVDPATDDHAFLDVDGPAIGERWRERDAAVDKKPSPLRPGERLIARIVSERGVYRPGEKVRVVGWSALDTPFSRSNLGRLAAGTAVRFALRDPQNQVVAVHATKTTREGKFWAELPVPAEARLGRYEVEAELAGAKVEVSVKVEDYRVPEFAVEARARRTDILAGESTPIDVSANYYFGGAVPFRRLTSHLACVGRRYRPPGLEDIWTVGEAIPWDLTHSRGGVRVVEAEPAAATPGRRTIERGGDGRDDRWPYACTAGVEVQDASLQGVGAEANYLVHPAPFYLALAVPRGYHEAGVKDLRLPVRAVDIAGARVAVQDVEVVVTRRWHEAKYRREGGKDVYDGMAEKTAPVKTCRLDLPASGPDPACELPALVEGNHEIAVVAREGARAARTAGEFHVYRKLGGWNWRGGQVDRLEVKTSRETVRPGDTLDVAVRGPWPGAHGTLVLARGGVRESRPLVLEDREALFRFTVDDTWTPEVTLQATVVAPPAGPSQHPHVQRARASVKQDFAHRRLRVGVDAPAKAGPGDSIGIGVRVRDDQDRPAAARVALWAVDEAVLDLTKYEVPDLQPAFVVARQPEIAAHDDYAELLHPYTPQRVDPWFELTGGGLGLHGTGAGGGGSGFGAGGLGMAGHGGVGPPPARSRFETTPVFLADLAVGASGEARVEAVMPENLSTFRITAIASARLVDGESPGRFGKNDARTVVTAPLVVRGALPRQLRPGDEAEFAAIVQNNTGVAGRVEVTAKVVDTPGAQGHALKFISSPTAVAELAIGGQARLPFRLGAQVPGAPEFELQAAFTPDGGGEPVYDGLRVPVPVEAERTLTERVATYGDLTDDRPVAIPVKIPRDVLPGHGGVTVAATSSLLGGLEDAVHALINYPHGCVEQTSSRLLPLVALADLRRTYPLGVADPEAFVRAGVERLLSMQTESGGFGYWPGARDVHVYASAYATWVLHLAAKAGYPVPEDALKRALDDLERRTSGLSLAQVPVDWGHFDGARAAIALHVLADAGRDVGKAAGELFTARQSLPLFGRAFLLMALHRHDPRAPEVATLANELRGNLQELQATAHASESSRWGLDEFFSSDGRSDAIILTALLRVEPGHPVIVKLARGLLERRIGGAWRNTQENAYALVALAEYARIYEAEVPDFSARAWVGQANVLDAKFKGREFAARSATTDMAHILSMSQRTGADVLPVVLQREGQGRMYYRLGAEWAPAGSDLPARAQGLGVTRALRVKEGPATGAVTAGEPVAMDITVTSDTRIRYVVVEVPLPAGLEGVSRTLGRGRGAAVLSGRRGWWVTHEEQRRDRVVVFADDLPPGTHTHTIDLRATGRGRFSLPPAHAEAMYMPEVYGRSTGATLEVR